MARIRSTHPGQWTDEDFVNCSPLARLLGLAIRNEADDAGIFEWKPITLKMRVMPADNVDVGDLLKELEDNHMVMRYEYDGKTYGAIRNFTKYQRPKKPKYSYPITEPIRLYVGLDSEPVPNQFPTSGEFPPQMKEEGGREERKYRFCGRTIKLNEKDYLQFKKDYHAIPDLDAELKAADSQYTKDTTSNWFVALGNRLNVKHQRALQNIKPTENRRKELVRSNVTQAIGDA